MKLFGEDPEISRLLRREVAALEIQMADAKHETESYRAVNEALTKENAELKKAMLEMKEQALRRENLLSPKDPFASWPPELRAQIDYKALGLEEPE
jgi:hypothetical protein